MKKFVKVKAFSEHGFNMFSAIVAIILIMVGVVMTSTLITTEEKTNRQIYSMLNNYQLADAANIARADALQTFNFAFREKLEEYLTHDSGQMRDNESGLTLFSIRREGETITFDDLKKTFEDVILLKDEASGDSGFGSATTFVADRTIDQFNEGTYGRFSVYLSDKSYKAKEVLGKAITDSVNTMPDNFLEVVGCDDTSCPVGTFYFNIPLNKLNDEEYESLPRIIVKDLVTQEEIKMAILPRTNLKVYIPLRFFKVLYEAKKSAEAISIAHSDLKEYKLGFCDACHPNNDPRDKGSTVDLGKDCPGSGTGSDVPLADTMAGVTSYLSGGPSAGEKGVKAYAAVNVCGRANEQGAFSVDNDGGKFTILDTVLEIDDQREADIDRCGFNELIIGTGTEPTREIFSGPNSGTKLYCGRITLVRADIVYKETNPLYIVKGTYSDGSDLYKIRIEDSSFERIMNQSEYPNPMPKCSSGSGKCEEA
ncbi:MAG: hypothetical protein WC462_03360 [archaeon]